MTDPDIVNRLRTNRECYAPCLFDEAADEIVRLLAERDEARRELDRLGPLLLHAASEIKKVCAERDEARREVCNLSIHPPRDYALERGWFCFKENP